MESWIEKLLSAPEMLLMGHGQDAQRQCLGLGWVYYGLARALRPKIVVVVGSWRGFVPLVLGKALVDNGDNGDNGKVVFIDPSHVDGFWKTPTDVAKHFAHFGVTNIEHYCMTTQEFSRTNVCEYLSDIGILFIDGMHTYEQAEFDYETFRPRLAGNAIVLFHDSVRVRESRIYGQHKAYEHRVKDFMTALRKRTDLELLELPIADGITLMRKRQPA